MRVSDYIWLGGFGLALLALVWLSWSGGRASGAELDARRRALSSALGRGERVTVSVGNRVGYPYRVAVRGRVYGFREWHEVTEFLTVTEERRERDSSAVVLSHPSVG